MIIFFILLFLFIVNPVGATTYWVSSGGSAACGAISGDIDPGSYGSIAGSYSCMAGGDTMKMKVGIYNYRVVNPAIPSGTLTNPTKIVCETIANPPLCIWRPTGATPANTSIILLNNSTLSYVELDGIFFDARQMSTDVGSILRTSAGANVGIFIKNCEATAQGVIADDTGAGITLGSSFTDGGVINCHIHDWISADGQPGAHGIYNRGQRNLIERNNIHDVNGLGIQLYITTATGVDDNIVRYNTFYNSVKNGIYCGSGARNKCHNNIIYNSGGGISVRGSNSQVYNNTIYNTTGTGLDITVSSALVKNNISFSNKVNINGGTAPNVENNFTSDPLFINAASANFALQSTSTAINFGTTTGLSISYNGSNPDAGAFETFNCPSGSASSNTIDVTCNMALNTPILPATGQTGWTVKVGGVTRSINSVQSSGSTGIRITFNGAACIKGEIWTYEYAPGNVKDSINIGGSSSQRLNAITTPITAIDNCGGGVTPPPTASLWIYYKLDENTGTNANDETANNLDGTLTNGPTWEPTAKFGAGVTFASGGTDYIAVPYGNGINPTTQSMTWFIGVLPITTTNMIVVGPSIGTNQRAYIGITASTWSSGVQSSSQGTNSEFPVVVGQWTRVALVWDSVTDTTTLWVNGVKGTSTQSVKSYSSFVFASNIEIGKVGTNTTDCVCTVDEFKVYTSALSDVDIALDYANWNPPAPTGGTFSQVAHRFVSPRDVGMIYPHPGVPVSTNIQIVKGGYVGVEVQTDGTVIDPELIGQKLAYTLNGGTVKDVPDIPGPDEISFYGIGGAGIVQGNVACCLVGALTPNTGTTSPTSAAPTFDLTLNSSIVQRYIVKITANAVVGSVYCFKVKNQNGNNFPNYTPTNGACMTVIDYAGSSGV